MTLKILQLAVTQYQVLEGIWIVVQFGIRVWNEIIWNAHLFRFREAMLIGKILVDRANGSNAGPYGRRRESLMQQWPSEACCIALAAQCMVGLVAMSRGTINRITNKSATLITIVPKKLIRVFLVTSATSVYLTKINLSVLYHLKVQRDFLNLIPWDQKWYGLSKK